MDGITHWVAEYAWWFWGLIASVLLWIWFDPESREEHKFRTTDSFPSDTPEHQWPKIYLWKDHDRILDDQEALTKKHPPRNYGG